MNKKQKQADKKKALELQLTTLRNLVPDELEEVVGGRICTRLNSNGCQLCLTSAG